MGTFTATWDYPAKRGQVVNAASGSLYLLATLLSYSGAKWLYRRHRRAWLSPLLVAPAVLLVLLLVSGSSYVVYARDTHWLLWMLGPATVAYAYPIYQRRGLLQRYPVTLMVGILAGLCLGLLSSWALGHLLALPPEIARSLLPRSVSTPFAIVASGYFGGSPDITVLCVLATGLFGMLVGEAVQAWLGLRSNISRGASLGASAHAAGTAKAYELDSEIVAVASLTMVLSGILMVLLAPHLSALLG